MKPVVAILLSLVALLSAMLLTARAVRRTRLAALEWARTEGVVGPRVVCDGSKCSVTGENFEGTIELVCAESRCEDGYQRGGVR